MSNCLLIILVIGSCVIFGGFPSRFLKCCFHSFILSCWFAAFSFALAVFFLLLTSFIVCQAILDCLSSTESLILSIWFWMYSICSFIYMPANWYCAVFSFKAFVFVGFFSIVLEAVSLVHVFLSPLKFPMGLYISFWVLLECISLLPRGAHWRNCHIRRLVYFFPSFLVVFRICFLILSHPQTDCFVLSELFSVARHAGYIYIYIVQNNSNTPWVFTIYLNPGSSTLQLHDHLPPTSQTIWVRQVVHNCHCLKNKKKIICYVLLWM